VRVAVLGGLFWLNLNILAFIVLRNLSYGRTDGRTDGHT